MQRLRPLLFLAVMLLAPLAARALDIPAYTPNVVDPTGQLSAQDTQRINDRLLQLRNRQHIWGAVYLVPSLQGESIEQVADAAFGKWKLGQQDADNGLLLVLAIEDRQSRFEVGYGLEGTLPDIVARHALDDALAPKMRQGETADAIIDTFDFMARVAAEDPATLKQLELQTAQAGIDQDMRWPRGIAAYAGLLVLVWITPYIRRRVMHRHRARLVAQHPDLADQNEDVAKPGKLRKLTGMLFIKLFATANPGVFVLLLSARFLTAFVICVVVEIAIFVLALRTAGNRYRSEKVYREFLARRRKEREQLIRRGHLRKSDAGSYEYTPSYYASRSSSSSSNGGSSGSSSSSSSGGGSSGGGGSSSSW